MMCSKALSPDRVCGGKSTGGCVNGLVGGVGWWRCLISYGGDFLRP